jgi:Ran GTPase-activating protein (RanGAP) involved in mRNA processing and transport
LAVEKTFLTPLSFRYLSSILSNCENIESLSLEDIVSSDNLNNQEFYMQFLETLCYLVHMVNLKNLSLSRNHMQNEYIKGLVPILKQCRLETLDLSGNKIVDEGFIYLCPFIEKNPYLKSLNLNYSRFRAETPAKELGLALSTCLRLEKISLKLCRITDNHMKYLV